MMKIDRCYFSHNLLLLFFFILILVQIVPDVEQIVPDMASGISFKLILSFPVPGISHFSREVCLVVMRSDTQNLRSGSCISIASRVSLGLGPLSRWSQEIYVHSYIYTHSNTSVSMFPSIFMFFYLCIFKSTSSHQCLPFQSLSAQLP